MNEEINYNNIYSVNVFSFLGFYFSSSRHATSQRRGIVFFIFSGKIFDTELTGPYLARSQKFDQ